jgi:hypothetical protein
MVVIYFSKKRLYEATRAWIDTSLFGSLLQIVSTTHKKNIKTTPYVLPGSQEEYIMTTPLLLPPFVSSLNRFFIFPSKSSLLGTPLPEQLKAQDLPEDDASQYTWASRQNPYSDEPLSCFHRGRCYTLQVLALIWLNTVCNPL